MIITLRRFFITKGRSQLTRINLFNNYSENTFSTTKSISWQPKYCFINIPIMSKFYHKSLPETLNTSILICQKQNDLGQKMIILEHITQLIEKQPRLFTPRIKNIVIQQLKKWENSTNGRMQKIATIAWIIKKLNLKKYLTNLNDQILQRIYNDQWYVTMQQSIKALQTYSYLPLQSKYSQQFIQQLFDKIQRNVSLTVCEVNMKYYARIFISLVDARRFNSLLFEKFQQQILKSLSMSYNTKTIFEIINCYAISRNGTDIFYEVVQQVMYRGHTYSRFYMFTKIDSSLQSSGQYLSMLAQTYSIVQQNTKIPLNPDFLDYLYKSLLNPKTKYQQLSSLTKLLKNLEHIQFVDDEINTIVNDIFNNKEIGQFRQLNEVYQLYEELQKRYGEIPTKINEQLYNIVMKQIDRKTIPLIWAIQCANLVLKHMTSPILSQKLVDGLVSYINSRQKYLLPDDKMALKQALTTAPEITQNNSQKLLLLHNKQE